MVKAGDTNGPGGGITTLELQTTWRAQWSSTRKIFGEGGYGTVTPRHFSVRWCLSESSAGSSHPWSWCAGQNGGDAPKPLWFRLSKLSPVGIAPTQHLTTKYGPCFAISGVKQMGSRARCGFIAKALKGAGLLSSVLCLARSG